MFKSGMRESWEGEVVIPGTSHAIFILLLEYLYTDLVPLESMSPETVRVPSLPPSLLPFLPACIS